MRMVFSALVFLALTQASIADERAAFFERLAHIEDGAASRAIKYLDCAESAVKEVANRDKVSPSAWMADWAATKAREHCSSEGKALEATAGQAEAEAIKAMVHRANVATALAVRRGDPVMACADVWRPGHGCGAQ